MRGGGIGAGDTGGDFLGEGVRLARTLRQDFKFASAEPPLSQLSRLFGRLRIFD